MTKAQAEKDSVAGLGWMTNGQSALSGRALDLYKSLDAMFLSWANDWRAQEYMFPPFMSAKELHKIDYFKSFPQLLTYPVSLHSRESNLEQFVEGDPVDAQGHVHLTELSDTEAVCTPAICLPLYIAFQGQSFPEASYYTTKGLVFRREVAYEPLQRQWSFSVRDIVCIGTSQEVQDFLKSIQTRLGEYFAKVGLPVKFEVATDPFFKAAENPKHLMQRIDPVKTEMIFGNGLAIGSINFHRSHFCDPYMITRDGEPLATGCVGFGYERWMYAMISTFGKDCKQYPVL